MAEFVGNASKSKLILHLEREIADYEDFSRNGSVIEPADLLQELLEKVMAGVFDHTPSPIREKTNKQPPMYQ